MSAINVEDEATNSCNGIFFTNNTTFRLSEITFEDQSPSLSLSIRGHPCSNQQFILPIISEKFVVSELTFVSTQLIFSLDQLRDRRPD